LILFPQFYDIPYENELVEQDADWGPYWELMFGILFACVGVWLAILVSWGFLRRKYIKGTMGQNKDSSPIIRITIGLLCTTMVATCTMMQFSN
jgi:hypothetical protein